MGKTAGSDPDALPMLLERARTASPNARIELRDPIAAHGAAAITAVQPWMADHGLCRFAVRVIWKAGALGSRDQAIAAMREALEDPTVAASRRDLEDHLGLLGVTIAPQRPPVTRVSTLNERSGRGWPGWQAHEFQTTDGTHWRSRDGEVSLVPILLRRLRDLDAAFESWSIYHSPVVLFADKGRYTEGGDHAQGWRASWLVVYAHQPVTGRPGDDVPMVTVGWWIERGDGKPEAGKVDDRWDWPWFLRMLEVTSFRDALTQAMIRHDLRLGDYTGGDFRGFDYDGRMEDGELVLRTGDGTELGRGWDALRDRLSSVPTDRWVGFHLWRSWPATEAIAGGPGFARSQMAPVLVDLARAYLDLVAATG
jgi:hypothetical protein